MVAETARRVQRSTKPKYTVPDKPPVFGRRKPAQRQGGSSALRDRSAAYEHQRQRILAAEPLCRYCLNRDGRIVPATILDHIVALALEGSNDGTNLAPACRPCNDAKSTDEKRYLAAGYAPGDIIHDPALSQWLKLARMP